MDTVFYGLLLVNFAFGVLAVVFLLSVQPEPADEGVRSLALPFIPLTFITLLQVADYYLWDRYDGRVFQTFPILYDIALVSIAFFWNYITLLHYELNGIRVCRPWCVTAAFAVAVILGLLGTAGHIRAPGIVPWTNAAVFATLFYAGIRGVLIIRNGRQLLPSSVTAVVIAGTSLVVYPAIVVGDVAGWRLPFLDPRIALWAQCHPLYITGISIPVLHYIYHHRQRVPTSVPVATPNTSTIDPSVAYRVKELLTRREMEILILLYEGFRYREIAEQLCVSLTTVRTHVHHIYEKLGISRKEELFIVLRQERENLGTTE